MKKNYLLSTVLSISALSVLPLASCAVEGTHSLLSTLKNTNETVNIKVSATVGTGHTFEGSPTAEKGKDYRCRFVSTRYEIEDELFVPVHKSLKPKDLEIICDGENIISSCTLQNNVLTIPANKLTDDITINILGAEIAEWMSWDVLKEISDDDVEDGGTGAGNIVKQYFEVGDYKALYADHKFYANATIIGFNQVKFTYTEGAQAKTHLSPFSFEILEPKDEQKWGNGRGGDLGHECPAWEEDGCTLWQNGWDMGYDRKFDFTPRMININGSFTKTNESHYSYFYVLCFHDMFGYNIPYDQDLNAGSVDIDPDKFGTPVYSYYRTNEYIYSKSLIDRAARPQTRWINNQVRWAVPPSTYEEGMYFLDKSDHTECDYAAYAEEHPKFVCWAFCY